MKVFRHNTTAVSSFVAKALSQRAAQSDVWHTYKLFVWQKDTSVLDAILVKLFDSSIPVALGDIGETNAAVSALTRMENIYADQFL